MGSGSTLFPDAGKAELADSDLNRLVAYMRLVSVPGQRDRSGLRVAHAAAVGHWPTRDD